MARHFRRWPRFIRRVRSAVRAATGAGWNNPFLRKDLAEIAFKLKPGEMSGVIETPDACYLMLVEQTRLAHVKPLSDVRDEIEKTTAG